jgi:hypothetical protein
VGTAPLLLPLICSYKSHESRPQVPPVAALSLNISLPFKPSTVESVQHGQIDHFTVAPARPPAGAASAAGTQEWVVSLQLPLEFGDFLLLE